MKHSYIYFKGKKIKEIYSNEISIKEKKKYKINNSNHNIIIINEYINENKIIKNIKLNFLFDEVLMLFYYKNNVQKDLSNIINLDENEITKSDILEGLIGKDEYTDKKGKNNLLKKQLRKVFDKIEKIFF